MNKLPKSDRRSVMGMSRILLMQLVIGVTALGINTMSYASESMKMQEMTVYKSPQCGCCDKWVEHLQENGFEVEVIMVNDMGSIKQEVGVPRQFTSCHTAVVGDYWVEGHVPADLIQKLLDGQPGDIKGIATPGMPAGSPGMESPNPVKYEVLSVDDNGNIEVYATRMGEQH